MTIERKNREIIIRIADNINTDDLQQFLNYLRYKELTSKCNAVQEDADTLASTINRNWWNENRNRLTE